MDDIGIPRPARYKATRASDGYHYMEIRMGSFKKNKYIHPDLVTFKEDVSLVIVEKVGKYGEVPR